VEEGGGGGQRQGPAGRGALLACAAWAGEAPPATRSCGGPGRGRPRAARTVSNMDQMAERGWWMEAITTCPLARAMRFM
jgi:hypothetical protein